MTSYGGRGDLRESAHPFRGITDSTERRELEPGWSRRLFPPDGRICTYDRGTRGGQDSRPAENPRPDDGTPAVPAPHGDVYTWYQRGLELLGRGSPAAAAQLLERAAEAEPGSRSVLEALGRAQFDTRRDHEAAATFRRIVVVEASPSDDYAHFGLGLAPARGGNPRAAAEHLALAAAMRPELRHYTDALQGVRATLRARAQAAGEPPGAPA